MELARRAVEVAVAEGAEFADAWASDGRGLQVSVEKNSLKSTNDRSGGGVSVCAIICGATGMSHDGRLGADAAVEAALRAVSAARLAAPDPDFVRLPGPEPFDEVAGLYDPDIASMGIPQIVEFLMAEVEGARSVDARILVKGGGSAGFGRSAMVNSCGIEIEHDSTWVGCSVFPTFKDGDDVGSYFDFDHARRMSEFAPGGIGRSAAEMAMSFRGARPAPTAELTVVLGPLASISLFSAVAGAAGADGIQRGRSFLAGKLGERIASEHVTIVDDGLVPGGLASGAVDGAGSVRRRVTVVEKGVFRQELHGLYTVEKAHRQGREAVCTGHGLRLGGVSPTNVRPALGSRTAAEILSEVDEGIYVNHGGVAPDMITGEISASVDFGFKIEKGRLAYPLRNTMLGINVFDLLGAMDAVSSDFREEPGTVMPTTRVRGVKVASARAQAQGG